MHEKSVLTLEFPKVLTRVAGETGFSVGKERVLALQPSPHLAEAQRQLRFTSEAVRLLDEQPKTGVIGAHDIRSRLVRARRGGDLRASDLVAVVSTLRGAVAAARLLQALDPEPFPQMHQLRERLPVHPHLVKRIEGIVNDEGEVLDTASSRLRRLRGEVRSANQRLQQRLRTLVGELGSALQEPIVTTRGDRYVLPVKADFRGRVRGIVHDQSASGATLFIEPLAIVELNNHLTELQSQEQDEIERVLREVSGEIGAEGEVIQQAVEGLAELDLQLAKARYSRLIRSVEPRLNEDGRIALRGARHPLLSGHVVPIDFRLGQDFFIVVITGPNTGGKTVALKTVGLLTLMAQAGLHVPAGDGSELAVVEEVFADIGDEQSIEQSLSTFSSHMTRIIEVLAGVEAVRRRARPEAPRVLVLFDELGAGTDPDEGSALARSILTYLLDRRVPTVATTHYSELKAFAHETAGAVNASVAFDVESLSPTYELEIGLPGRSNALAIAERLGLDPRIIRGARAHLGTAGVRMEGLLRDLEQERDAAADEREQLALERRAVEDMRLELKRERQGLEEERASVVDEARSRARRELDAVVAELAEVRAQARREDLTRSGVEELRRRARRIEDKIAPATGQAVKRDPPAEAVEPLDGRPEVGDVVRVASLGQVGELLSLSADGSQAEVLAGSLRLRVGVDDLQRVTRRESGPERLEDEPARSVVVMRSADRARISQQLDMRGWRVEDALPELESYLNDAVMSGLSWVRIIHGRGTGALRAAVREHLAGHPLVQSSAPAPASEGGDGVTIVRLSA
ncbi:MAG TPA: endonuclease MutS2 [Candidatus Dormibacteraeota bacterium]|nr:endonuclease MutS2 [Candidatus Dormibacteraeota bacterium]